MTIGTLIHDRLTGYSGISAIVGTRIYPMILPQHATLEAITYQRISSSAQNGTTALRQSRWQISCWAETYAEAHTLSAQVKAALEEHKDTSETPGIKQTYIANELDDYDDVTETYRIIVDVILVTTGD